MRRLGAVLILIGIFALGWSASTALANPPYKTIVICWQGETIEVPLWKWKAGDYPGATEGECAETPPPPTTTEPPPTTTEPPPTTTEPPPPTTTEPEGSPPPPPAKPPRRPRTPAGGTTTGEALPYTGAPAWALALAGLGLLGAGLGLRKWQRA